MYHAVTRQIAVTVEPEFLADRSDPEAGQYVWAYTILIENRGTETVQLLRRHWIITDALGRREEVRGDGVVGEQPIIGPGESYSYTSGCPLSTPGGIMVGTYAMVTESGEGFSVAIPAFSLDVPELRRVLN